MTDKQKKMPKKRRNKSSKTKEKEAQIRASFSMLLNEWFRIENLKWVILPLLSILISILLFPNLLNKPQIYRLGDVSDRDIKASRDFLIENKELTETNREKAVKDVLSIYDFDNSSSNLATRVIDSFNNARKHFDKPEKERDDQKNLKPSNIEVKPTDSQETDINIKNQFFSSLEIPTDDKIFKFLKKYEFSKMIEIQVNRLLNIVLKRGIVGNNQMLADHIEKGGIILHEINQKKETKVNDINLFYDLKAAENVINNQLKILTDSMESAEMAQISIQLALTLLKPNLTYNQRETELRKDLARESIKPIFFRIKRGEMLVREGELIGPDHLLRLSVENESHEGIDIIDRVPAMAILMGFLLSIMYYVGTEGSSSFKKERKNLIFTSLSLFAIFVFAWAYSFVAEEISRGFYFFGSRALLFSMPLAFGAMLMSIFQGIWIAMVFSLVISVLASILIGGQVEFFIFFLINSIVAAHGVKNCNERGILIKTGFIVGLVNIILSLSIEAIHDSLYSLEALVAAGSGFMGGILAGVIATGILPLVEMSFGFTTDIKLLELASLDQPLLRDLMVQSPGTYHHSMITSNMVEATAKAVQANPLLAKVSAYYHDIGKMKKPLYFIENQIGIENRHDKLAPSMSSLILISHVKDGVDLGKQHRLGQSIMDIIQQHHGTSLISYFYQKAKDREDLKGRKTSEIKEQDFRYPGPKPQTKEAGLVMLADMVEAASRSLVEPTPSRIQGTVQNIINKAFSDGQLNVLPLIKARGATSITPFCIRWDTSSKSIISCNAS